MDMFYSHVYFIEVKRYAYLTDYERPAMVMHMYHGGDGYTYCGINPVAEDVAYTSDLNKMTCKECDKGYDSEHG